MTVPRPEDARRAAIDAASRELAGIRSAWRTAQGPRWTPDAFPGRDALRHFIEDVSIVLFPRRLGAFAGSASDEADLVERHLHDALEGLEAQVATELAYWQDEARAVFDADQAPHLTNLFAGALGRIRQLIDSDVDAAFLGDPAARSTDEILVCYPGAIASLYHRIAHELDALGVPIIARIISELANERTGVDIHPGATIGHSFFIDHGTGVVIGETAIIGANVRLYQHVTLGARSLLGAARHSVRDRFARHPIVEDDVVIYAGATILGRVTIGAGATIGGNVWLLHDVPAGSVVTQPEASVLLEEDGILLRDTLLEAQP